jgi:hypothetical protein
MSRNAECVGCGITAADMPYEEMGMTLEDASEFLFVHDGNAVLCSGCAA